jgi:hypothetical protein
MSKNRIVNCTVNNQSGYSLTYNTDSSQKGASGDSHGSFSTKPVETLPTGASNTAFVIQQSGITYGSTGWVSYNLNNNQGQIIFMFNNPYNYEGKGNSGNCWFYAVIQGSSEQAVGRVLSVYATVSGFTFNADDPTNSDTMNITVNVYSTT